MISIPLKRLYLKIMSPISALNAHTSKAISNPKPQNHSQVYPMPSQHTQWYKDQRLVEMLDNMRRRDMAFMAKCYFCNQKSEGIKAISYKLYPVCSEHDTSGVELS